MKDEGNLPYRTHFDEFLAQRLIGRTLLVGITEIEQDGSLIRRRQVFGTVTVADRSRGICIKPEGSAEFWLPPDTRSIRFGEPGEYRNRTTGEVVTDPDFLTSWVFTKAGP